MTLIVITNGPRVNYVITFYSAKNPEKMSKNSPFIFNIL